MDETEPSSDSHENTPGPAVGGVLTLASGHVADKPTLDAVQARVLGALIEKETTTPELYPLSLNSLRGACNQSSNRHPVMDLSESDVTEAIDDLKAMGLARVVLRPEWRGPKFRHVAHETWELSPEQLAFVCVLLLRGQQTVGELKGRTERLATFADLHACETQLETLATAGFVVRLPRAPGQKEARWAHLLSGEPELGIPDLVEPITPAGLPRQERIAATESRVDALESRIAALEERLAAVLGELGLS